MNDHKLTWKNKVPHIVQKLCVMKDILSKLRHYMHHKQFKEVFIISSFIHIFYNMGLPPEETLLQNI